MRIPRLFIDGALQSDSRLHLDRNAAHYVTNVLRLKKPAELTVFNGLGGEYSAVLTEVSRHSATIEIGAWKQPNVEPSISIELALGICRGERMDFAVQKAVELGVNKITPLRTQRCVVHLNAAQGLQKCVHWRKIVQSACEQCGRTTLPGVSEPADLINWLNCPRGIKLLLDPKASKALNQIDGLHQDFTLLSGPEGGFTEDEMLNATGAGFEPVRLGPRILRAETSALASVTAIQTLWGDFRC